MSREKRDWVSLVREQLSSGKSQAEFCRERGVSLPSFQYHKSKGAHLESGQDSFISISGLSEDSRVEVWIGRDVRVYIPSGMSAERLSEVLRCLSSK